MKNLLLFCILVCSSPVFCQVKKDVAADSKPVETFNLSVLGGLNINHMPYRPNIEGFEFDGTYNSGLKQAYTFFGGLSARQPIHSRFAVKIDVQIVAKGYRRDNVGFGLSEQYEATYFDMVPQFEYNFFENLYFSLGGYGGLRLEERIKFNDQQWQKLNPDFISFAENSNWGLVSGFRAEFDRVSILVKYLHGLTPAIKMDIQDQSGTSIQAGQFHRSLQIGLGFRML